MTETEPMNSPMIHMTKMKLKTNKMKETISFVGHQEHLQQLEIQWSMELMKKYGNVKVFHFSGARIKDLNHQKQTGLLDLARRN